MKRVDIPAESNRGDEAVVHITAPDLEMRRLNAGIAAYEAFLRRLTGYGLETTYDPDVVHTLLGHLSATAVDVEVPPRGEYDLPSKQKKVEVSIIQAEVMHIVAQTMVAKAAEMAYLDEALAWPGSPERHSSHGWHESPLKAWERFEQALAPPAS